ncbi:hypothetical protein [Brachybacterium sp. Marseille-Q7125]|uniref:hypothetical protein n=1 Tax=Brachybacterium sp. Marseille-Q7125 TaxID=2932815 RepID=UPI0032B2F4DA
MTPPAADAENLAKPTRDLPGPHANSLLHETPVGLRIFHSVNTLTLAVPSELDHGDLGAKLSHGLNTHLQVAIDPCSHLTEDIAEMGERDDRDEVPGVIGVILAHCGRNVSGARQHGPRPLDPVAVVVTEAVRAGQLKDL